MEFLVAVSLAVDLKIILPCCANHSLELLWGVTPSVTYTCLVVGLIRYCFKCCGRQC